jgi:hypothetical protein
VESWRENFIEKTVVASGLPLKQDGSWPPGCDDIKDVRHLARLVIMLFIGKFAILLAYCMVS